MKIQRKEIPWINPFDAYTLLKGDGPSFLLESLGGSTTTSRYSYIGQDPEFIIRSKGNRITVSYRDHEELIYGDPFVTIRNVIRRREGLNSIDLPPFAGGAVGYFGYDMAHLFESLPHTTCDDLQVPEIVLIFADVIAAFDHEEKRGWIIAVQDDNGANDVVFQDRIKEIEERLKIPRNRIFPAKTGLRIKMTPNLSRKEYIDMVRQCKEYIASGDIYQANLSQRLSAHLNNIDPLRIYRILREINPSPFSAFLDTGEVQLISSSPERLVKLCDKRVETRPIAGTRQRVRDNVRNGLLRKELLASEKERAEHIMLVDLERSDIGQVCKYGSIRVNEFMVLESYSHVTHIVSNISGEIETGKDALDLIRAVFPGGTITGVPKIRSMQIIDELEPTSRGPYTGSIGYLSYTGNMDLNIIIRTFVIKDDMVHIQVGAGIVADSDPEKEYYETLYKAEALLKTLEML